MIVGDFQRLKSSGSPREQRHLTAKFARPKACCVIPAELLTTAKFQMCPLKYFKVTGSLFALARGPGANPKLSWKEELLSLLLSMS